MASNPKTCTSDNVTYETVRRPESYSHRPGDLQLEARCADCGTYASVVIDEFDEVWMAQKWNAHHAWQMAQHLKAPESSRREG